MSLDDMLDRIENLERRLIMAEESLRFLCTAVLIECDKETAKRVRQRHLDFITIEMKFDP